MGVGVLEKTQAPICRLPFRRGPAAPTGSITPGSAWPFLGHRTTLVLRTPIGKRVVRGPEGSEAPNSKLQGSLKSRTSPKFQHQDSPHYVGRVCWRLDLGVSLELKSWGLEFRVLLTSRFVIRCGEKARPSNMGLQEYLTWRIVRPSRKPNRLS